MKTIIVNNEISGSQTFYVHDDDFKVLDKYTELLDNLDSQLYHISIEHDHSEIISREEMAYVKANGQLPISGVSTIQWIDFTSSKEPGYKGKPYLNPKFGEGENKVDWEGKILARQLTL